MASLEEGGQQLAVSKKTEKAVQKALKAMMETWTPHGPSFISLTFNGAVGYGWDAPVSAVLQLEQCGFYCWFIVLKRTLWLLLCPIFFNLGDHQAALNWYHWCYVNT